MSTVVRRRTALVLASLVASVALLSGCVGMPTEGPVVESKADADVFAAPGTSYDPLPPQAGQSPSEIVSGFLEAMKATPIGTSVARQYLTAEAQGAWRPERHIVTYDELDPPIGRTSVSARITDVDHYDQRGAWVRTEEEDRLGFVLTVEDGEWRIGRAPNALVVPDSWFEEWYQRVSLYYFDPTAQILVPEPVFVPKGDQFASALVRGLLTPPTGRAEGVVRTFFPTGTEPGLSVPIDDAFIAEVSLDGDPDAVDEETAHRIRAQLVWTLRQEERIRAVELTIGGRTFGTPGASQIAFDVGAGYDPTGADATSDLFALQDGLLVRGQLGSLGPTKGPFGQADLGVTEFGVNLSGETVAAVTEGGTSLVLAPVDQAEGQPVQVIGQALDLLQPVWDHRDRVWAVDRAGGRARVFVITDDVPREVVVRGISGRDVTEVLVSRDGTRLVAVVRGAGGEDVVAARVQQDSEGRLVRVLRARPLALPEDSGRIRDLAWRTPTAVSILSAIPGASEVRTLSVDGAPADIPTTGSTRPPGRTSALVSSPVENAPVYAVTGHSITDLTTPELTLPDLPRGLTGLSYSG